MTRHRSRCKTPSCKSSFNSWERIALRQVFESHPQFNIQGLSAHHSQTAGLSRPFNIASPPSLTTLATVSPDVTTKGLLQAFSPDNLKPSTSSNALIMESTYRKLPDSSPGQCNLGLRELTAARHLRPWELPSNLFRSRLLRELY